MRKARDAVVQVLDQALKGPFMDYRTAVCKVKEIAIINLWGDYENRQARDRAGE